MTRYENLQQINKKEFIEWLDSFLVDIGPQDEWFDYKYCQKCETVCFNEQKYSYCELNNHCKFFPEIKGLINNKKAIELWLDSEV